MQVLFNPRGEFRGFRLPEPLLPVLGPPVPVYGPIQHVIGEVRIDRYPDGHWGIDKYNGDYDEYGVTFSDDEALVIIATMQEMLREREYPLVGWRHPDGRYEQI